jgi:hypothetical protein
MTMQHSQRVASWLTKDAKSWRPETCATTEQRDEILNNRDNKHSYSKEISINEGNETSSETKKKTEKEN